MLTVKIKKRFRIICGFLLLAGSVVSSSCGLWQQPELERNRRLWRESGITSYRMTVDLQKTGHAAPSGKFIVTVRGKDAESIKRADDPEYDLPAGMFRNYDTIEKIFDYIERADKEAWIWDTREIEYDLKLGYPKKVNLDAAMVLDEELFFQVLQFEILQ